MSRPFEWQGIRFAVPDGWTLALAENGALAFGSNGETLTITRRQEPLDTVLAAWDRRLAHHHRRVLADRSVERPVPSRLRVMVVNDEDPRVLTQLLVGGSDTVVATYAAPADESYDPRQANAVIEAILARQLESAA